MAQHDPNLLTKLRAIIARLRVEFANDPNVNAIGWGLKRRGDTLTDDVSIIFYVNRKFTSERAITAAGSAVIPDEIDGFPTDVEEDHPDIIAAGDRDEEKYDPLIGGPASSNAEGHIYWFNGHGTLGLLVRDASSNAPMALSNWHVWADGGEEGDAIIQPGHPTAGDHIEGIGKVLACGPLLGSLIEWEAPSPLAAGLYAGAAAAAVAAALSDHRDPSRRGQDATPVPETTLTELEDIDVAIEYPELPLPGKPFRTDVKWAYERHTNSGVMPVEVTETRINSQFLAGQMVVTDRASYRPGERITLTAAIWDYQPRPCDAYHVVAHMIPHNNPDRVLRTVLQPTTCPRTIPTDPRDPVEPVPGQPGETICTEFHNFKDGTLFPSAGVFFGWLRYQNLSAQFPTQVRRVEVAGAEATEMLQIPSEGYRYSHAPASKVSAQIVLFASEVKITAFNRNGAVVGQAVAQGEQGVIHEIEIEADGITTVEISGGSNEAFLARYCITLPGSDIETARCIHFDQFKEGREFPHKGAFRWLRYVNPAQLNIRIVQFLANGQTALLLPPRGLRFSHAPTSRVTIEVAEFAGAPITLQCFGAGGQLIGSATSAVPNQNVHELSVSGNGIVGALVHGGGGEGLLVSYCVAALAEQEPEFLATVSKEVAKGLRLELPQLEIVNGNQLRTHRCCFTGTVSLPPDEDAGKWDVHLIVQNVNHVPDGTPPEQAATVIGGHVLSENANALGCAAIMLLDHVFDVI